MKKARKIPSEKSRGKGKKGPQQKEKKKESHKSVLKKEGDREAYGVRGKELVNEAEEMTGEVKGEISKGKGGKRREKET